ncbi:MAG: hypothetical protein GTO18_20505, partial [Anaerolineales bacterium]|nr:hypothetical protein [Anaerolineales bacterium]
MRARIGEPNLWIRLGWLFLMVLLVLGAQELFLRGFGTGDGEFIGLTSFKWGIGLIGFGFVGLAAFIIAGYGLIYPERTSEWLGRIERWLRKYRFIQWPIMLL